MTRRAIQTVSLLLFVSLLLSAAFFGVVPPALHAVLALDPALAAVTAIASRAAQWVFIPAAVVMVSALLVGRGFCGWVCPMGTTLALADRLLGPKPNRRKRFAGLLRLIKYGFLAFMLVGALFGVSWVFLGSPLSLIARFYALFVGPALTGLAELGLTAVRPLAESMNWHSLAFAGIDAAFAATWAFAAAFFGLLFAGSRLGPRLWCRFLCPAGALLALASRKPLLTRRRVSDTACGGCNACANVCPMDAIPLSDAKATRHEECILCTRCATACPTTAISFLPAEAQADAPLVPARRDLLAAGLAGGGLALLGGLVPTAASAASPIRPPGAVTEDDFLARCTRCGACTAICPTHAIQPLWGEAGLAGVFSPALTPLSGPCDPHCSRCGDVCPTGALRELRGSERLFARSGTAEIIRDRCLAWHDGEKCVVCDEVCPYDAIVLRAEPGIAVPVPEVKFAHCAGCGYCEHECPVAAPRAIRIMSHGAIRLTEGSFEREGRAHGIAIALAETMPHESYPTSTPTGGPAPGFTTDAPAPGFTAP